MWNVIMLHRSCGSCSFVPSNAYILTLAHSIPVLSFADPISPFIATPELVSAQGTEVSTEEGEILSLAKEESASTALEKAEDSVGAPPEKEVQAEETAPTPAPVENNTNEPIEPTEQADDSVQTVEMSKTTTDEPPIPSPKEGTKSTTTSLKSSSTTNTPQIITHDLPSTPLHQNPSNLPTHPNHFGPDEDDDGDAVLITESSLLGYDPTSAQTQNGSPLPLPSLIKRTRPSFRRGEGSKGSGSGMGLGLGAGAGSAVKSKLSVSVKDVLSRRGSARSKGSEEGAKEGAGGEGRKSLESQGTPSRSPLTLPRESAESTSTDQSQNQAQGEGEAQGEVPAPKGKGNGKYTDTDAPLPPTPPKGTEVPSAFQNDKAPIPPAKTKTTAAPLASASTARPAFRARVTAGAEGVKRAVMGGSNGGAGGPSAAGVAKKEVPVKKVEGMFSITLV